MISFRPPRRSRPAPAPAQPASHHHSHARSRHAPHASEAPAPVARLPERERGPLVDASAPLDPSSPFGALGLAPQLLRALAHEGYERPTPIQAQAIPHVLQGRDLLACAQTGTGKTAAFVLPMLQRLARREGQGRVRSLVLTPPRELAAQIGERAEAYGRHLGMHHAVIFGGVSQGPQEVALRRGLDLLIATPGRLLDLMQQRHVDLSGVEAFVLDEADRMLDMGFVNDVRRVVAKLPRARQTLMFSATMPPEIATLAQTILHDPVRVSVTPQVTTAETVDHVIHFVDKAEKATLLVKLLRGPEITRALVFSRTKRGADKVQQQLTKAGIESIAIHGNKSQNARTRALDGFRQGEKRVLVATDIAARGIDVEGISHVINYDLPNIPESYVHRIGRTGRAGATGSAVSFCDPSERDMLADIERFIRHPIPLATGQSRPAAPPPGSIPKPTQGGRGGGGRGGGGGQRSGGQGRRGGGGRGGGGHGHR